MKELANIMVTDKEGHNYEDVLLVDHKNKKAVVQRYIVTESGVEPMIFEEDFSYAAAIIGGPIVNLYNRIFNK